MPESKDDRIERLLNTLYAARNVLDKVSVVIEAADMIRSALSTPNTFNTSPPSTAVETPLSNEICDVLRDIERVVSDVEPDED